MANEIPKDEILKDKELDQVAGGNAAEIQDDANKLRQLGFLRLTDCALNGKLHGWLKLLFELVISGYEPVNQFQVRNAFLKLPVCGIIGGSIAFGYYGLDQPNEYQLLIRGEYKKVTRQEFWDYIFKQMQTF